MTPGRPIWFIGASGAGKDSLMRWMVTHGKVGTLAIAQRTITRASDVGDEGHLAVDAATFLSRERAGEFALTWRAHGCCYGIPTTIERDLQAGRHVVIAGSRAATGDWCQRFPNTVVVLVRCAPDILAQRLHARARDDGTTVSERIERARDADIRSRPGWIVIDNDNNLCDAGEQLTKSLHSLFSQASAGAES